MKKGIISVALLSTLMGMPVHAEVKLPSWLSQVKLSGYGMIRYAYNGQETAKSNSFELRMLRVSLEGRIAQDFYWKTQIQFNGNTSTLGSSPRVVDLFAEWQKYDFLRVKIGQFKNPFLFENPMNPIDQGFRSYSQAVLRFAGFSDRSGKHSSNGRDIGLQLQGDFLKNASGRNLLHYQVGVFNGQGINVSDVDQRKNVIGGLWVMPVAGMRLGAFGWTGSYARKGNWTDENGKKHTNEVRSLDQERYAFSGEYVVDDWTFRSEYAHSYGYAFQKALVNTNDASSKDCTVNEALGNKSQAVYALVIAPIIKKKLHAKVRYDMYQPTGDCSRQYNGYEFGMDYNFHKNFQISAEYGYIHDRGAADKDYSVAEVAVNFKF